MSDEPTSRFERALARRLPPAGTYAIAVAFEKGASLISIPIVAAFLSPADYGRFDIAVSVVELVEIIAATGFGPQLIRFAQTAMSKAEERRCAQEILGVAIGVAAISSLVVLVMANAIATALDIGISVWAFQILLVANAANALIEVPVVWMRLKDRPGRYLVYSGFRTIAQVAATFVVLSMGYGVDGMMAAGGAIQLASAAILCTLQIRETGVAFPWSRWVQAGRYAAPIVGSMLAMYAIMSANRLFLNGAGPEVVPEDDIGEFGLAIRLAFATYLLAWPFELWWGAKRIAALREPGGLERSAQMWGAIVAVLIYGALGVSLAGPVFIHLFLPDAFNGAIALLPIACGAMLLHQVSLQSNVGAVARENGYQVLAVDSCGAVVAIVGYMLLIPSFGVVGALAAMGLGHGFRFVTYLVIGARVAPIRYPLVPAALSIGVAAAFVMLAPGPDALMAHLAWGAFAAIAAPIAFMLLGLAPTPEPLQERLSRIRSYVR